MLSLSDFRPRLSTSAPRPQLTYILLLLATLVPSALGTQVATAQEQSVKPGINDSFRDPKVEDFTERFEVESREVYALRKEIVAACEIKPGMVVADIGAGTGLFTRLFASAVGEKGRVLAVDITPKFLEHIQATAREANLPNIDTILCSEDSTKLPPESVDLAFICDTYHHFEFPYKTMDSLRRALRPGGRVVMIDFRRIPGESSDWTLNHVRAGQEVFESEILRTGFRKVAENPDLLKENYFVVFEKDPQPTLVTPIISGVGGIRPRPAAVDQPTSGSKVVFDATADFATDSIQKAFDRAARLLNLYGDAGLAASDIHITIVVHGEATKAVLSDAAYQKRIGGESNPNLPVIRQLQEAGVEILVCGQALNYKALDDNDVDPAIPVAASALTVLIHRQADGHAYLPMH